MKREGFWKSAYEPNLPIPAPHVLQPDQAYQIFALIHALEQKAHKALYRGRSYSRIDGTMLGNAEYEYKGWQWPGDFAAHYVLQYRVKPSDEFLEFIGYKEQ